jgi:hypothetical protein
MNKKLLYLLIRAKARRKLKEKLKKEIKNT